MKRIGDILTRNKTAVVVEDSTSYKQVTIRTNYKGVCLRGTQDGSTILTKNQFVVSAGQFILSRIDARNGAFGIIPDELEGAIVTNDFLAFDINEDEVEIDFFNVFLQSPVFLEACIKASRGNTNRKRVDEDFFLKYEVNLPSRIAQSQIIKRINKGRTAIATAQYEITHQEILLAKLKQAILQEAISGKLTADWRAAHPDVESASHLLHRIQAEKACLIAAKKIRPEKPLPKITPAEIPFEIPKGWEWCRLGEVVILKSGNAYSFRETDDTDAVPYIKVGDMNIDGNREDATQSSTYFVYDEAMESQFIPRKSIIFPKRGGAIATNKRCKVLSKSILVDSNTMAMCPSELLSFDFVFTWFLQIDLAQFGNNNVLPQVNNKDILPLMLPLPPLAEQAAIVERVEALMTTCRALEAEIEHARTHAAHLHQAVLKEAFAPAAS
jgi:type I restriction enzyme S subunit